MIRKIKGESAWGRHLKWWEGMAYYIGSEIVLAPLGLNILIRFTVLFWEWFKFGSIQATHVAVSNWPQSGIGLLPKETMQKMGDIIEESHKHMKDGEEWRDETSL